MGVGIGVASVVWAMFLKRVEKPYLDKFNFKIKNILNMERMKDDGYDE